MSAELGTPGRPVALINGGAQTEVHVGNVRSLAPLRRLRALVDTGAQLAYYIDIATAKEIGLREIEGIRVPTSSAAGVEETPVYSAQVRIPALGVSARAVPARKGIPTAIHDVLRRSDWQRQGRSCSIARTDSVAIGGTVSPVTGSSFPTSSNPSVVPCVLRSVYPLVPGFCDRPCHSLSAGGGGISSDSSGNHTRAR